MKIRDFCAAVVQQNRDELRAYFAPDAVIRWHCTNEQFTLEEYIRANCDYPGDWDGELERVEETGNTIVCALRVFPREGSGAYHVVSFLSMEDGKIAALDEYWADDGPAPAWRQAMNIGRAIKQL